MSFTPKPNTGYLWKNDKKTEHNHPDLRGDSLLDRELLKKLLSTGDGPVKISVSAWKGKAKDGNTYVYLSFSEPFVPKKPAAPKVDAPEDDEDVPF